MKNSLDPILLLVIGFLAGGLTLASVLESLNHGSVNNLIQGTIAVTAIYALTTWKRQHKYTTYQEDKKRAVEITTSLAESSLKLFNKSKVAYSIRVISLEKTGNDYGVDDGLARRIEICWAELDDKIHELQVESERNEFITENPAFRELCAIFSVKCSRLADATMATLALSSRKTNDTNEEKIELFNGQIEEKEKLTNEALNFYTKIIRWKYHSKKIRDQLNEESIQDSV